MKILIYLISFLFISCSSYNVKTYYDEFDHYEWFRFENNDISEDYSGIDIEINPQKWIQGESVIYSLQIQLIGNQKLNVSDGFSLLLSFDGKRVNLENKINLAFKEKKSKQKYYEEAWFDIDKEILYNISFSEITKFKLIGKTEFIQGVLSEFNQNTFKDFYRMHVDDSIWEIPSYKDEVDKSKFSIRISSVRKPEKTLKLFNDILLQNGWSGDVNEYDWNYDIDEIRYIQKMELNFDIPVGENMFYYPKFLVYEIMYSKRDLIPLATRNDFQEYPCPKCPESFPILNYSFLFDDKTNEEIYSLNNWFAVRNDNNIYLIYGDDNKSSSVELSGYLSQYFQSQTQVDIKLFKDLVKRDYQNKLNKSKASFLIQEFLEEYGFYNGPIDGLFGEESRISFQRYLRSRNFYKGEIDGKRNKTFTNAVIEYQRYLDVEPSGWINLSMAKKMKK